MGRRDQPEPRRWTDEERDPGLAAERTKLAWGRTTMSIFACGAAVAKGVPTLTSNGDGRPVVGLVILALGALMWVAGLPLSHQRHAVGDGRRAPSTHELLPLAVGATLVGCAAFVIAAFFPG